MPPQESGAMRDLFNVRVNPERLEVTTLTPQDEQKFKTWVQENHITDLDHPRSYYDYRGYWKDVANEGLDQRKSYDDGLHFPDTYKQHGHPTFSIESKYSMGPNDGGRWGGPEGETFIPANPTGNTFSSPPDPPTTWQGNISDMLKRFWIEPRSRGLTISSGAGPFNFRLDKDVGQPMGANVNVTVPVSYTHLTLPTKRIV